MHKNQKKQAPESKGHEKLFEGIISTTQKGIGFVPHPDFEKDVRIEAGFLNTALNGDTVKVCLHSRPFGAEPTGEVVDVLNRAKKRFVGTLQQESGLWTLSPDDRKMYTSIAVKQEEHELTVGTKALVEIIKWSDPTREPLGKIITLIGKQGEHETEMQSIVLERGIDTTFPSAVEAEAHSIKEQSKTDQGKEIAKRKDMRGVTTFTIDPVDAKDFDDALSIRKIHDSRFTIHEVYEIGIHIADVSHYVRPQTELDREARERAFSAYLVDRTIPMLPEILSNDLCSLNPNEEKLAFSVICIIDESGKVHDRWFGKTVIRSDKRFTYEEAQNIIDTHQGVFFNELAILNTLAKKMMRERKEDGAIDFEQNEVKFVLDENNKPVQVIIKERLDTHKLVEEFMLLANREVATFVHTPYEKKQHAFIYRIHDTPKKDKISDLVVFLKALGHELKRDKYGGVTGKELNRLFDAIRDTPEESLIKTTAIRSMAKAVYSTKNIGHFGLSFKNYTHFTSPIRRYADLIVHRLLYEVLTNGILPNQDYPLYDRIANDISGKELMVVDAERESIKYKQVEYMSEYVGKTFDGVISGVSEWGIFVEERTTKADGLIRVRDMNDDYYVLEPKKYRLVGEKTKKVYSLGDQVKIKVARTDLERKMIDYVLIK